jgi:hypothetical protein
MSGPTFQFKTKADLKLLLGKKAKNVEELLEGMKTIPDSSIYCHTHRLLQSHRITSPEPPNDFAYWAANMLNDEWLGEQLASVDIVQFQSSSMLRKKFIQILENYLQVRPTAEECPPGQEFHFMANQTFVLSTPYSASTLTAFRETLERISIHSLRYHMFDTRLQLGKPQNDFAEWAAQLGHADLARELSQLDPYTRTLEGLRRTIIEAVRRYE